MKNIFASLLIAIFALSFSLAAQPRGMKMDGQGKMMKELKLTDQQKEQWQKVHFDAEKKNIESRAKIETAHLDLKKLMLDDKQDKSAIEKKMKEIADLQVAEKMNRFNTWSELNKTLTPEQQVIWKKALLMRLEMNDHQPMKMKNFKRGMRCPNCDSD